MMLPLLILLSLLGAALIAALPARHARFSVLFPLLSLLLVGGFMRGGAEWSLPWLPDAGISLRFQLDGLSMLFVLMVALVSMVALVTSLLAGQADRGYFALILVLQSALFGVFTARHFISWFLCWELTLIPAYLLIRQWGGSGAPTAALRFFIMTLGGSAFMLVGFLALQLAVGTMDFDVLGKLAADGALAPALATSFAFTGWSGHLLLSLVALAVFLGLAVKIPVVPFHAWLPAAYAEAPTPVTMLLTGLLSKMGVYALLRIFLPVFPEVLPALAPILCWLAVATIVMGAVAALAQTDLKRMLAYSSVNHLGYCVLAVAAVASSQADRSAMSSAISGTVLQAFNHGIIATALFFGIAILEKRSRGQRGLNDFGGLRASTPVFCGLFGIAVFASLGLPGLSGFVGEFLIFNGAFALTPAAAVVSVSGLLLTAVFLLRMLRKVFWGPLKPSLAKWPDLSKEERWVYGLLLLLILAPGLWPQVLLGPANPAIVELLDLLRPLP
jgi:NADH-quinone oxidoreductase subunit M